MCTSWQSSYPSSPAQIHHAKGNKLTVNGTKSSEALQIIISNKQI